LLDFPSLEKKMTRLGHIAIPSLLALALVALTGCPPKAPIDTTSGAQDTDEGSEDAAPFADSDITTEELETLVRNFERVHFDYDKSELDDASREVLAANSEILLAHPELQVKVEGHADRWGSDIYNLALGQKRAESVRTYLLNMGVLASQLQVISFGEERPLTAEGDRNTEAPNRRAEFLVTTAGSSLEVGSSY
jgi:peptidoglycan-associated lipoprotein